MMSLNGEDSKTDKRNKSGEAFFAGQKIRGAIIYTHYHFSDSSLWKKRVSFCFPNCFSERIMNWFEEEYFACPRNYTIY